MESHILEPVNIAVVVCYFLAIVAFGIWKGGQGQKGTEGYFLAGRTLTWPLIGASLFSSIGSTQFVGQAGGAFALGIVIGNPQLNGGVFYVMAGLFIIPIFLRMGLYTLPEFLEKRYGIENRIIFAVLNLITIVAVRLSIGLYAGALVLSEFLGIKSIPLCVLFLGLSVSAYAVIGGLSAVVYTDAIQTTVLVLGGALTLILGLHHVGGWAGLTAQLDPSMFHLLKPIGTAAPDFPWTSIVFGLSIVSLFYCANDQETVQRLLGAKNEFHAKMGSVFAGFLKVAALFVVVVPGLIAKILFPEAMPDKAYALLVLHILPAGINGVVLAGLLAALMSSLDSSFCAACSIATMDFYKRFGRNPTERQLVLFGRVAGCVLFGLSMLWAPYIARFGLLYVYLLKYYAYVASPFVACYLFGILSKRVNRVGATVTISSGLLLGLTLMIATTTPSLKVHLPTFLAEMHFYHLNIWLFVIAVVTLFVVSYFTRPPSAEQLSMLKLKPPQDPTLRPWYAGYKPWAVLFFVCVAALYLYFD